MPDPKSENINEAFPTELERLKIENLLLKQKADLEEQFRKHMEKVDGQISKGNVRLGFVGLLVLGIAWYPSFREVQRQVQKRLDAEFSSTEIQHLIRDTANAEARKAMQKRLEDNVDVEHNRLKCVSEKFGRDLFSIQCRLDGGDYDEILSVCAYKDHGNAHYNNLFPEINCEKLSATDTASATSEATTR